MLIKVSGYTLRRWIRNRGFSVLQSRWGLLGTVEEECEINKSWRSKSCQILRIVCVLSGKLSDLLYDFGWRGGGVNPI